MDAKRLLTTLELKAAPENAAVVVVDVQNDFAARDGFFHSVGADIDLIQRTTIPGLVKLLDKAREAGVLVIFIQAIYDEQYRNDPMVERKLRMKSDRWPCISGTWGAEFHAVSPQKNDVVVVKHRYSGMLNTELEPVLKRHNLKSLLMTGIATDTCVESTARDAYFLGYYVSMVSDCCGALNEADHTGALKRFARDYGPVVSSDELIAAWQRLGRLRTGERLSVPAK